MSVALLSARYRRGTRASVAPLSALETVARIDGGTPRASTNRVDCSCAAALFMTIANAALLAV